jgi:hypothetical protein
LLGRASLPLLLHDRPIFLPQVTPPIVEGWIVADWEFGSEVFIEVDPQSRFVVRPEVAILQFRTTREDILLRLREHPSLLDTEVRHREIQVHIGSMPYR